MRLLAGALLIAAAFVVQAQIAGRVAPGPWRIDLLLGVLLVIAVFSPGEPPLLAALLVGVLEGVLCGMYTGAFITSRVVATVAASYMVEPFNLNLPLAVVAACFATAVCHLVFLIVHPQAQVAWWFGVTVRQLLLAVPLAALLYPVGARWLAHSPSLSD